MPQRDEDEAHPYLTGNFAPITTTHQLTKCSFTGEIPSSLANGQYVRNGANPLLNEDAARAAHWFDGDGMLTGVLFEQNPNGQILPKFVNQWIETDIWKASRQSLGTTTISRRFWKIKRPIPPSITTLINPAAGIFVLIYAILRTVSIVIISHLSWSRSAIKRISVANTGIYYHDGRALATCESGPPMQVKLPELSTIGWFNGLEHNTDQQPQIGGSGMMRFLREYTTGHPKMDPETGEMIMFHNTFIHPYVQYSVVTSKRAKLRFSRQASFFNLPVPGITSPKLMHDFGVSDHFTVILDLPLSLDPVNLIRGEPIVSFDSSKPSRFGVFPRHRPDSLQWFEDDPCVIFHTACTWDEYNASGDTIAVCMLACRMNNASVVFATGNINPPSQHQPPLSNIWHQHRQSRIKSDDLEKVYESSDLTPLLTQQNVADECRLHFYRFSLVQSEDSSEPLQPSHSFALSALSLEFPTSAPGKTFKDAQYIYACSSTEENFSHALGKAAKINILAKLDVRYLIQQGRQRHVRKTAQCVDSRSVKNILEDSGCSSTGSSPDTIRLFQFPDGIYGGEPRFVAASSSFIREDDGHLLFFAFDETQLLETGVAPSWATSELWILDARGMSDVVAKIQLTQRVPYGLHGEWFNETMIREQISNTSATD